VLYRGQWDNGAQILEELDQAVALAQKARDRSSDLCVQTGLELLSRDDSESVHNRAGSLDVSSRCQLSANESRQL
jgi:hypothetical protein